MRKARTLLGESVRSYDHPTVILDVHTVLAVAATAVRQFSTPFEQRPDRLAANTNLGAAGGSRQQDVAESEPSTWMCCRTACQQHRNRQKAVMALLSRAAFLCGTFFGRAKKVPRRVGAKARHKQLSASPPTATRSQRPSQTLPLRGGRCGCAAAIRGVPPPPDGQEGRYRTASLHSPAAR